MSSSNNKSSFDSHFGQSKVFGLDDPNVDPNVVQYLQAVRNEAFQTSAISMTSVRRPTAMVTDKKYEASIYDDYGVEESDGNGQDTTGGSSKKGNGRNIPTEVLRFNMRSKKWLNWFYKLQKVLRSEADKAITRYDEETLNLLLFYLKQYLLERAGTDREAQKGITQHLSNLLQEFVVEKRDDTLEIDEKWISTLLSKLQCVRIPSVDSLKMVITGDYSQQIPYGFKQWNQFVKENQPCNAMFQTMIFNNRTNIWLLVRYMSDNWLYEIVKKREAKVSQQLTMWLLYILVYLPDTMTATNTSTLRDLGRKCQEILVSHYSLDVQREKPLLATIPTNFSLELNQLRVADVPANMSVVELALALVATRYGQSDLTKWNQIYH